MSSEGNYVASACVDFSMEEMHRQNIRFIVTLAVILVLAGVGVLLLYIIALRRMITKPLLAISKAVSGFKHDTEENRNENYESK